MTNANDHAHGDQESVVGLLLTVCNGDFQESLITGKHGWQCNDLKGEAREWRSRYFRSTLGLKERIKGICSVKGWSYAEKSRVPHITTAYGVVVVGRP